MACVFIRDFITLEPFFNLCKVTVDGLIQLSDIRGLIADTHVIRVHGHS